jgi:hypothetical protein
LLIRYLEKKFFKSKKEGVRKGFLEKLGYKKKKKGNKGKVGKSGEKGQTEEELEFQKKKEK